MTKKWKQKWDDFVRSEFFRSKKCERFIIGLLIYTLTVGFGCIILGELTEDGMAIDSWIISRVHYDFSILALSAD